MSADLEARILSGEFFNGPSRSSSPARSPSSSRAGSPELIPGWHDDELFASKVAEYRERGLDVDEEAIRQDLFRARGQSSNGTNGTGANGESIGMGPGRTGVKGVIRDRNEAEKLEIEKKTKQVEGVRQRMEKADLGGKTYLEEEREKLARGAEKVDELVLKEQEQLNNHERQRRGKVAGRGVFGEKEGKFGHLREVGLKGFIPAVEEGRGVWVVVHLYDSSLERCYIIDEKLSHLAREYPDTKFLRARASVLGFASTSGSRAFAKPNSNPKSNLRRLKPPREEDEDDPYGDGEDEVDDDAEEDQDAFRDDDVDLDMLPTMLVYRDGELVHNWVRVDWEAGDAGIEELLDKHRILAQHYGRRGDLGFGTDEEGFDFTFSDDD